MFQYLKGGLQPNITQISKAEFPVPQASRSGHVQGPFCRSQGLTTYYCFAAGLPHAFM